jgi:hypothetical protein
VAWLIGRAPAAQVESAQRFDVGPARARRPFTGELEARIGRWYKGNY